MTLGLAAHATHWGQWIVQMTGRTRWFLLPPKSPTHTPSSSSSSSASSHEIPYETWAESSHTLLYADVLEDMRAAGLIQEVITEPGDVLFVPADWGRASINLCESVVVSGPIALPKSTSYTAKSIPISVLDATVLPPRFRE